MPRIGTAVAATSAAVALLLVGSIVAERHRVLPRSLHGIVDVFDGPHIDRFTVAFGIPLPRRPDSWSIPDGNAPGQRRIDWAETRLQLDQTLVAEETKAGYLGQEWPHWLNLGAGCMDSRQKVLAAEVPEGTANLSGDGCRVLSGPWRDPYTKQVFLDPRDMQIDHLVPLVEAYRSGGSGWSQPRKAAYANDTSDPRTLVAVGPTSEHGKNGRGPEAWLPPSKEIVCTYVADWVAVKARWELSMDPREWVAVDAMVTACSRTRTAAR